MFPPTPHITPLPISSLRTVSDNKAHSPVWGRSEVSPGVQELSPSCLKCDLLMNTSYLALKKKSLSGDFLGGPVVKTLRFHCRGGMGFIPGGGTKIPCGVAKKKKKKEWWFF